MSDDNPAPAMNALTLDIPAGGAELVSTWDVSRSINVELVIHNTGPGACIVLWGVDGVGPHTLFAGEWATRLVADEDDEVWVAVKSEQGTRVRIGSPAHNPRRPQADVILTPLGGVMMNPDYSMLAWIPKPVRGGTGFAA